MDFFEIKRHAKLFIKHAMLKNEKTARIVRQRKLRKEQATRTTYHSDGPRAALKACDTLKEAGIEAWLYAGSLLGAVRDGAFISWDNDLDLCIIADEEFDWSRLEIALNRVGFQRVREFRCDGTITEQAYSFGASHFDIFAMKPTGDDTARVCIYMKRDDEWYKSRDQWTVMYLDTFRPYGRREIEIEGCLLPVPDNAEQLLEMQYGPGWRVPDPDYADGATYSVLQGAVGLSTLFVE